MMLKVMLLQMRRGRRRTADSARALAEADQTRIALVAEVADAGGAIVRVGVLAHLVGVEGVAAAGPGGAGADAPGGAGAANGAAFFQGRGALEVVPRVRGGGRGAGVMGVAAGAGGGDALKAGKPGDAIGAFGLEGGGGGGGCGGRVMRMAAVRERLASVAVFDGGRGKGGEGGGAGVGGASVLVSQSVWMVDRQGDGMESYGPMSDGVTGSEGGGGRLMRVGVVMVSLYTP